jgi:hypothetical protein
MSTRNLCGVIRQLAGAWGLTNSPSVNHLCRKMWAPLYLTTVLASVTGYRDSHALHCLTKYLLYVVILHVQTSCEVWPMTEREKIVVGEKCDKKDKMRMAKNIFEREQEGARKMGDHVQQRRMGFVIKEAKILRGLYNQGIGM